jgi:hypothetical protein
VTAEPLVLGWRIQFPIGTGRFWGKAGRQRFYR